MCCALPGLTRQPATCRFAVWPEHTPPTCLTQPPKGMSAALAEVPPASMGPRAAADVVLARAAVLYSLWCAGAIACCSACRHTRRSLSIAVKRTSSACLVHPRATLAAHRVRVSSFCIACLFWRWRLARAPRPLPQRQLLQPPRRAPRRMVHQRHCRRVRGVHSPQARPQAALPPHLLTQAPPQRAKVTRSRR